MTYSILVSQVGYPREAAKKAVIRSHLPSVRDSFKDQTFQIYSVAEHKQVYTGDICTWGEKWGSFWWILDFSALREDGSYTIVIDDNEVASFCIQRHVFLKRDIAHIALDQLDERNDHGDPLRSKVHLQGKYTVPGAVIWRDCGSNYAEIPSVGIVLHALIDLYERHRNDLSDTDRQRLIDNVMIGANYIVDAQQTTDDPETDGRFVHSILVNALSDWEGSVYIWHDIAYAIPVLVRASKMVGGTDEERSAAYLAAAVKAWELAVYRPYYLESDFELPHPEARRHPFWKDIHSDARYMYNIEDPDWKLPRTLRTREMLPFLWGCLQLFEATSEERYMDKAIEFADRIAERQYMDWSRPIEGAFGMFYEFADHSAFLLEFAQCGHIHMGNIDPVNLQGFIRLLELKPDHPRAAVWYNVVQTYGEHYVKRAAELNPLGIYPVTSYADPVHGGVKFFQNILHGCTCLYGQIAKNLLEIGDFLNDRSYHNLAEHNLQFVLGLNPGIPSHVSEDAWEAKSLLVGIGDRWFEGSHNLNSISDFPTVVDYADQDGEDTQETLSRIPAGSGVNGFSASEQFSLHRISERKDAPKGILRADGSYDFNEDWIAHSHGYVSGVALFDAEFVFTIKCRDAGKPVRAEVEVAIDNGIERYATDSSGVLSLRTLPPNCTATVSVCREGRQLAQSFDTLGGGSFEWLADFANHVEVEMTGPPVLVSGLQGAIVLKLVNRGYACADVEVSLSAVGGTVDTDRVCFKLEAGESAARKVTFYAGSDAIPYLVYASVLSGEYRTIAIAKGKVATSDY